MNVPVFANAYTANDYMPMRSLMEHLSQLLLTHGFSMTLARFNAGTMIIPTSACSRVATAGLAGFVRSKNGYQRTSLRDYHNVCP
jgi:hypothetical protein